MLQMREGERFSWQVELLTKVRCVENMLKFKFCVWSIAKARRTDLAQDLSGECLMAKIGVVAAQHDPLKFSPKLMSRERFPANSFDFEV